MREFHRNRSATVGATRDVEVTDLLVSFLDKPMQLVAQRVKIAGESEYFQTGWRNTHTDELNRLRFHDTVGEAVAAIIQRTNRHRLGPLPLALAPRPASGGNVTRGLSFT
ncbi:MAG: hypothetical protein LC808_23920 [Actinobacteria bacterium]|nr:hypothetical protein [Actinomycetota bacterium]